MPTRRRWHAVSTKLILPDPHGIRELGAMHAGEVAEEGTHDELLDAGGIYASMWRAFETIHAHPAA